MASITKQQLQDAATDVSNLAEVVNSPVNKDVPLRLGGVAATLTKILAQAAAAVASGCLPLLGGTMLGNLIFNNNTGIFVKDSAGVIRQLFNFAVDNTLNLTVPGGKQINFYNQAGNTVVFSLDNSGKTAIKASGTPTIDGSVALAITGGFGGGLKMVDGANELATWAAGTVWNWGFGVGAAITSKMTLSSAGLLTVNSLSQTSDETKKFNWRLITDEQLDRLADVELSGLFDWLDGSGSSYGTSAQQIREIFPDAISEDAEGGLSVNFGGLGFAVLQASLARDKRRHAALEARLAALEAA